MRKENKHLLKTIISNQELIMKALHIAIPEKKAVVKKAKAVVVKKVATKTENCVLVLDFRSRFVGSGLVRTRGALSA